VNYEYRIGKHEVSIAQFMASGAGGGDLREDFWNSTVGPGGQTVGPNAPACNMSFKEAMRYCNWLTTGNVNSGLYGDRGDGRWLPLYNRDTAIETLGTFYAIPTEDEWYKAAYWTGSGYSLYANGADTKPIQDDGSGIGWNYYGNDYAYAYPNRVRQVSVGEIEQNGTINMMGNVEEITEGNSASISGGYRGGTYLHNYSVMNSRQDSGNILDGEYASLGLRVVQIPEPTSAILILLSGALLWFKTRVLGGR